MTSFKSWSKMLDYHWKMGMLQSIEVRQMIDEAMGIAREADQQALARKIKDH